MSDQYVPSLSSISLRAISTKCSHSRPLEPCCTPNVRVPSRSKSLPSFSSFLQPLLGPKLFAHSQSSVELHMWGYPVLLFFDFFCFKTFSALAGTSGDLVIRVAALLRNLSSDIKAPAVPTWWLGAQDCEETVNLGRFSHQRRRFCLAFIGKA